MCGACGRMLSQDRWSVLLTSRRSRWEAGRLVNDALAWIGHPARVSGAGCSWVVRSGTGRDVVVDTLSQIWAVAQSVRPIPAHTLTLLSQRLTPVDSQQVGVRVATAVAVSACESTHGSIALPVATGREGL